MAWIDPPTHKQLSWIEDIEECLGSIAPRFSGSTRRDAAEYIDRYARLANDLAGAEFEAEHPEVMDSE